MTKVYILILCTAVYHFIYNLIRFLRSQYFLKKYKEWLLEKNWELVQHQNEVIKLLKGANINNSSLPIAQSVGYGKIMTATTLLFENFPSDRQDAASIFISDFNIAIGFYKNKMLNSFNPLFWFDIILNLPKNIFLYLSISTNNLIVKIFQLLYWFISFIFTIFITFYNEETIKFIKGLITKL